MSKHFNDAKMHRNERDSYHDLANLMISQGYDPDHPHVREMRMKAMAAHDNARRSMMMHKYGSTGMTFEAVNPEILDKD